MDSPDLVDIGLTQMLSLAVKRETDDVFDVYVFKPCKLFKPEWLSICLLCYILSMVFIFLENLSRSILLVRSMMLRPKYGQKTVICLSISSDVMHNNSDKLFTLT